MQNDEKNKSLVQPQHPAKPGEEVTLEQLESLCYNFTRRPRGCGTFGAVGDSDDILF